jgi:hypothetical protein
MTPTCMERGFNKTVEGGRGGRSIFLKISFLGKLTVIADSIGMGDSKMFLINKFRNLKRHILN